MKKWIIIGAVLVVLAGLVGTGVFLLNGLGGPADDEALADQGALDVGGVPFEVEMGEISSVMVLDAVVAAEPGEAVKARNGGTVTHLWVAEGAEVEEGAPIVNVKVPDETAPAGGDGEEASAPATTEVTLYAPTGGTVSGLDEILVGDVLEPGSAVAEVAPDEFRAVASIPANDLYRFYEDPEDIMLKIDKGPPAAACAFLTLGAGGGGGGEDADGESGGEGGGGGGAGGELTCRVPSDLQVFDGVQGKLSVTTGEARNVLVVPVTAVRGNADEGEVVVLAADGSEEVREVALGVSDGSLIEVTDGLSVGDTIMDPVPLDPRFDVPGAGDSEEQVTEEEG